MPNQFLSPEGDIENYFVTDYQLIDQYIGDTLWTWGYNDNGQLGTNDTVTRNTPVTTLLGGTNWKSIAGGDYHTAALKIDGTLWSWGRNNNGQLGTNDTVTRTTPVQTILGGNDWKTITSGPYRILALKTDGTLWTWGVNGSGQLGINDKISRSTPVTTLLGGNDWKSIATGTSYAAALKTDGSLWTWGFNGYGQLGTNDTVTRSTPVQTILGGNNWKSISCGEYHIVALKTDGTLWTWGRNNYGQLGINVAGATTGRTTPVQTILGGNYWKSIFAGGNSYTAAIKTDGSLWIWGINSSGQLGVNDTVNRSIPVQTILGGNDWKSIKGGPEFMVALKTDGSIWTWGNNDFGQLGVNDTLGRTTPVQRILGGNNWKSVASGRYHTVALTAGQSVDFR